MKVQVILGQVKDSRITEIPIGNARIGGSSISEVRSLITLHASRKFGTENRDWRMVGDHSLFTMYAKTIDGTETIILR